MRKKKSKKICILGKLPTKFEAPFEDKSWEIWAFNEHKDGWRLPRVDKWFNLHAYAAEHKVAYTIKNFPFKLCEMLVGGEYFNNCVSYLIAFAILRGATEIALYGCNFDEDGKERSNELANVRELVFFARGHGVKVTAPEDWRILNPWYRYIDWRKYEKERITQNGSD